MLEKVIEPVGMTNTTALLSAIGRDAVAQPHGFTPRGFERIALEKESLS